ncbi:MAG: AtpZ/AtpI family protein [Bacteroidales bacterium]|nr:AtpZ/AtpI family protein [Bacteroidales bacterium]
MSNENNKKFVNNYIKYSSLAIQMALIIFFGILGGIKLDEIFNLKFPIFTIILSLLCVFASIYLLIKEINSN